MPKKTAEQEMMDQALARHDQFIQQRGVFVEERNVVMVMHWGLGIEDTHRQSKETASEALKKELEDFIRERCLPVVEQIKHVYLFMTEDWYAKKGKWPVGFNAEDLVSRKLRAWVAAAFKGTSAPPAVTLVGYEQISGFLGHVGQHVPTGLVPEGSDLAQVLVGGDKGGYDTPKFAISLVKWARRNVSQSEMIIQLDWDVTPSLEGIKELKRHYYEAVRDPARPHFCFSWNYYNPPFPDVPSPDGPSVDDVRTFLLNAHSVRTGYMVLPPARQVKGTPGWGVDKDGKGKLNVELSPEEGPVGFDAPAAEYLIRLLQLGRCGSALNDPISGAGMTYSPDALEFLPHFLNVTTMISWIDDYIRGLLIARVYAGKTREPRMYTRSYVPGFQQVRDGTDGLKMDKHVKWHVNSYLPCMVRGCLLAYVVDPGQFVKADKENPLTGLGDVLAVSHSLDQALVYWQDARPRLREGCREHLIKLLSDWHRLFCEPASSICSGTGYLDPAQDALLPVPSGFVKRGPETPFNAWVLAALQQAQQPIENAAPLFLVDEVMESVDRYLDLVFRYWPFITQTIDEEAKKVFGANKGRPRKSVTGKLSKELQWLFAGVENLPTNTRINLPPSPVRVSEASFAVILRDSSLPEGKREYLVQWNEKWNGMNLPAGHYERGVDAGPLVCMVRELREELFRPLDETEFSKLNAAFPVHTCDHTGSATWTDDFIEEVRLRQELAPYPQFSKSASVPTVYRHWVYDVTLKQDGLAALFQPEVFYKPDGRVSPRGVNEWVTVADVTAGFTKLGRPISDTVKKVFKRIGIML